MTAASQEMADLLREVQKLQKELQPVRSAIATLQKREAETPNPAAVGASLNKVAARLETVKRKYEPYFTRLQELLCDEVPAYLQQTPLLAAEEDAFERGAAEASGAVEASPMTEATPATRRTSRSAASDKHALKKNASDDAARIVREVCPPTTPHLLHPANLRFTQQQLRLRAEMVEYLIETDRVDIADHVARSYGLPLQWFPRLVAQHRERTFGSAADAAAADGFSSPTSAAMMQNSLPTPSASPLVTPATRPRGGGMPPKSPITLPAAAVSAATAAPTRGSGTGAPQRASLSTGSSSLAYPNTAAVATTPNASTHSPPSRPQQPGEGATNALPSRPPAAAASAGAAPGGSPIAAAPPATAVMPDLVARVVSAAMYLKDEYVDRMVLERMLEQQLGLAPLSATDAAQSKSEAAAAATTPLERYKACVLSRIANIPCHHLHTQSGDPAFDNAMMNIIEDLLVYGLQRWAEDDTGTADEASRNGGDAEATAAAVKARKADLLRTLTTDTLLTPEEMLLADRVWSDDILFLKRPTRFYCVESGLSTDEAGASALAAPRARATGEVVSQSMAETRDSMDTTLGIFIT